MDEHLDFERWWESRFGFNRLGNLYYPFLKRIHALGGDPEYVLRLTVLFSRVDRIMKEIPKETPKRRRPGISVDQFEAVLREFGWDVFIGTLADIDSIYTLWKTHPKTFPSREFLDVLKCGQKIIKDRLWKFHVRRVKRHNERVSKGRQEIAESLKSVPFGEVIYEYAFADVRGSRGNQPKLWETFCATALTEHLRKSTPGKRPYFSIGAWLINGKPARRPRQETKRIGERVRQFKRVHSQWAQQLERINRELEKVENLNALASRISS